MTRPTDASIARAFFEISHIDGYVREAVLKRAAEFDAESPAGCKVCGGGNVYCAACMSKTSPEVTTSPERVQIPAESKRVCSWQSCRAEMRPGLHCDGAQCPLRK